MTPPAALSIETPPSADAPSVESTPAPAEARPSGLSAAGCLRDAILVILGALVGVALALTLLFYINGTLDFGRHERISALASSLDDLQGQQQQTSTQVEQQATALNQLGAAAHERYSQMDALVGQIGGLETQTGDLTRQIAQTEDALTALDSALQATAQDNEDIREQTNALADQIALLSTGAERFRVFVAGLRDLANSLAAEPAVTEPIVDVETVPAPPDAAQLPQTPALTVFPPLEPLPQPPPGQSLIYGVVWADANADGQPTAGEPALISRMVSLRDARGQELAAAITDANGRFFFDDLVPGSYSLVLIAPDDAGADEQPQSITVLAGPDLLTEVNFGLLAP